MAVCCVVREVCIIEIEKKEGKNSPLQGLCTVDPSVGHTVTCPYKLWLVGEVIQQPHCEAMIQSCLIKFFPHKLDVGENTGEIKKHDSLRASHLLQVRGIQVE